MTTTNSTTLPAGTHETARLMRLEFFTPTNPGGVTLTVATNSPPNTVELPLDARNTTHLLACMTRLLPETSTGPWLAVGDLVNWLDNANGTSESETALRLLKLSEEVGEASAAYIGATGQNPRKGTTHTPEDVADELCDVIITAKVALHRFTANPEQHFAAKLAHVTRRMNELCTCDEWRDDPCPVHAPAWPAVTP